MIAFGAACNIGDQLHPTGLMDMETYRNIGQAYAYVEKIEQYGPGGKPISNLGLWLSIYGIPEMGASQMLLELQMDFQIANKDNLDAFETIIIPSRPVNGDENIKAIQRYMNNGGHVVFMAEGALKTDLSGFAFDVGADLVGHSLYDIDYTLPMPLLGEELIQSPTLNYIPAMRTAPHVGTEILAGIYEPYFSRTYEHYSSHRTPLPNRK